MSDLRNNINEFIKHLQVPVYVFEESIGMSNGSINKKKKDPNYETKTIIKIKETYPQLNINWFLTGEGNMLISETKNNNSDPPHALIEENKRLETQIKDKEIELRNLNRAYADLGEKYDNLERKYKILNAEPLKKMAERR